MVVKIPEPYLQAPEKMNMAWYACDRWVEEGRGEKIAIYFADRKITWGELQALVNKFGNGLKKLGISKGSTIMFRLENTPEYYAGVLAGMKLGAVPIPTSTMLREREIEYIINNSKIPVAISAPELMEPIENVRGKVKTLKHIVVFGEAKGDQIAFNDLIKGASDELKCAETSRNDPAYTLYTSGTTGVPKGVAHAHRWIIGTGDTIGKITMGLTPDDISFHPQEISFMFPFGNGFFYPFYCGAATVIYKGRIVSEKALEYIQKYRPTVFSTVPSMYRLLLAIKDAEKKYDLASLKRCLSAGETLPSETYEEWKRRFGIEIYDAIGQTEIHFFVSEMPGMKIKPGSMGKPFPKTVVKVVDDDGKECPPGTVGNLVIKDDTLGLFYDYVNMAEKWKETHRGGWYWTGDLARVDEEGYFWYVSRADDMIKSRGYLIGPKEVEDTLLEHPAVLEAGVVGTPDPMLGTRVKAFLTLRPRHKASKELAEELREHAKSRIAPYKIPKDIEFVEFLPKTATGKILRRELRRLEKERYEKDEKVGFFF